jgi:TolB-like protein/Tfp pilus assembly protein PilF
MPEGESDSHTGAGNQAPAAGAAVNPGNAVFISYASQDTAVADALCAALERAGIACWIAPRNVTPGDFYADAIVQAINACRVLVLVLSENSITSPHVVREVERASAKQRPVISFRIDLTPLPPGLEYFLSASHWLDASAGAEAAFPKLIETVRGRMASGPADGLTLASAAADGSKQSAQIAAVKSPPDEARGSHRNDAATRPNRGIIAWLAAVAVAAALAYVAIDKFQASRHRAADAQTASGTAAAPEAVGPTAAPSDKSIAVLPFADMSEKKDQEYFSDGLAEELIGLLAKIPGLHVPARTSSFYFKGKQTTIAQIAKALGVANVLEGSVRKSGNTLRITAQLIRADNGYDVWSETYDRQLDDIFKVQDEIAGAVVKALRVSLLGAAPQTTAPTSNSEAYALYLKAKDLHLRASEADENQASDYLQQALKLDPKFALAWAMLADVRTTSYAYFSRSYEQSRTDALYAATQALQLDPNLSGAHAELARVRLVFDWDWHGSEAEDRKALELDPTNAHVLTATAFSACYSGRFDEALRLAGVALARDPLDAFNYQVIAHANYRLGKYPQAAAALRRQIELYPNAPGVHYRLALVQVAQGQPAASFETMQNEPDLGYRRVGLPLTLDAVGRKNEADAAIAQLAKAHSVAIAWSYQMALIYAHRHDVERALAWLDSAYVNHDSGLLSIVGEPLFKPLESDPRYQALLHKMKFSE